MKKPATTDDAPDAAAVTFAAPAKATAKRVVKSSPTPSAGADGNAERAGAAEQVAGSDAAPAAVVFQAPEQAPVSEVPASVETSDTQSSDTQSSDTQSSDTQTSDTQTSDGQSSDSQSSDGQSSDGQSSGLEPDSTQAQDEDQGGGTKRRRRRGGRRRRKGDSSEGQPPAEQDANSGSGADQSDQAGRKSNEAAVGDQSGQSNQSESPGGRRRRRRRRSGDEGDGAAEDPANTVTRVRKARSAEDEITGVTGSTRLEAKKQRRREGREAGKRRAPIVSEAEFLARREAVTRVMVIRQHEDLTQIAVLEDDVLVEHYVSQEAQTSLIGNVYLGRVQNVLPSMEAAFVDIGKGRNAVLYAGEVNWHSLGGGNGPRKIEQVLKSGQPVLVQVTKDPIGHKGARLTSQITLPGRFLVYVPDGNTSGISRKLPDSERNRLKTLLKQIVPDSAGVIVRTAAEGASETELTRDVERLTARWEDISAKVEKGSAPALLYGEPDLTLKVVRDLFTEDFEKLVVSGADAWDMVEGYVRHVAPDLQERLERYEADEDAFAAYRIDEQLAKGLDRKVWLPSGGSLVIDRTEAMTVVDVNTGKFTGSGGNLEETVTKNNLEAAEEMVRQLRLRDLGGIIVVDFIDMVLESNRDLVLRRLVECLGRDRTRHQVAEVTSLGLIQMTRKRIGTGLLEAFSTSCEHCQGRGVVVHHEPVESAKAGDEEGRRGRRGRGRGGSRERSQASVTTKAGNGTPRPSPKDIAAMTRPDRPADGRTVATTEADAAATPEPAPAEPAPAAAPAEAAPAEAAPAEAAPADSAPADPAPTDPEPEESLPVSSVDGVEPAERPAVSAAPRLVTTSRRVARRPAGPPAGVAVQTAEAEQTGAEHSGAEPGGAEPGGAEPGGAEPGNGDVGG